MKLLAIPAAVILSIFSAPSVAQNSSQLDVIYVQPLEGVYSQSWLAQVLGSHQSSGIAVYVVGEGKLGDFFGVISVDCQTPSYSTWLATGGFLSSDRVPDKAVQGIRKLACGG